MSAKAPGDTTVTMRAVRVPMLGSIDNGRIERIPIPRPGPGDVLVEVRAVAVNYVDLLTIEGRYQFHPDLPYTPGKGPAGVVLEVGSAVQGLGAGDRVIAMAEYGGYAEKTVVDHRQVHPIPPSLDFTDAATMAVAFDTAWVALRERTRMSPGDSVLVMGATGAVGGAAIQLARAMGASTIIAGLSAPERLEASWLGELVDDVVDLGGAGLRDSIPERVRALTEGNGVDVVIDPIGGEAFDGAIRAVAWRGRYVVVGFASGDIATLRSNYVLLKNIEVSGLQISDYRRRLPSLVAEGFEEIFAMFQSGSVRPLPHRSMPLDDWAAALRSIEGRTADRRMVLVP